MGSYTQRQRGAVSLFVVVFAMLLLTVVTVSFLRIMMSDLRQASDTDLSQSAYDSAQAGVEDAKRALLRYQAYCQGSSASDCASLEARLSTDSCNAALLEGGLVPAATGEVPVQTTDTSTTAQAFHQAYTCVTIKLDTNDVVGTLNEGASSYVPLKGTSTFNEVTVKWLTQSDLASAATPVSLTPQTSPLQLLPRSGSGVSWPSNRPPVVRAQLLQTGSSFTLDSFDYVNASSESNSNTLFLYPTSNGTSSTSFVGRDIRANSPTDSPDADSPGDSPLATHCEATITGGGYACSMTLTLPTPIGGGDRSGYLRLTPFYRAAQYQVSLSNNGLSVPFKAVQPSIDSTGRANDLFRRVEVRVRLDDTSIGLPESAVDVTTEFCKDFSVTNTSFSAGVCSYN